jgi:capsule polysaccharide export protein KpsE/RkpR
MTPEPDQEFYHEKGAKKFVLKYGHDAPDIIKYFTGTHKIDTKNLTSKMTLMIKGFDFKKGTISDMADGQ